jgi:hypothetical protein
LLNRYTLNPPQLLAVPNIRLVPVTRRKRPGLASFCTPLVPKKATPVKVTLHGCPAHSVQRACRCSDGNDGKFRYRHSLHSRGGRRGLPGLACSPFLPWCVGRQRATCRPRRFLAARRFSLPLPRRRRSDRGRAGTVSRETCRGFSGRWLPLKSVDALAACTDATLALSRLLPGALQVCHWVSGSPFCAAHRRRGRRRPACVRMRTFPVAAP